MLYELFQANYFQKYKFQFTVEDSQPIIQNFRFITQLFFRAKNTLITKFVTGSSEEEGEIINIVKQIFLLNGEDKNYR